MSEDINFDSINLDMETVKKMKNSNFWTFLIENIQLHLRFGEALTIDELISFYPKYEEPLF